MARIAGVDLPRKKRVEIAPHVHLRHRSHDGQEDPREGRRQPRHPRRDDLTEDEIASIREAIDAELQGRGRPAPRGVA